MEGWARFCMGRERKKWPQERDGGFRGKRTLAQEVTRVWSKGCPLDSVLLHITDRLNPLSGALRNNQEVGLWVKRTHIKKLH